MRSIILFFFLASAFQFGHSQTSEVNVFCNLAHEVGTISEFDRKKYINLHASLTSGDWTGEEDKMEYLLNDLDVYLGRDNGFMGWYMNQSSEDTRRPGFVSPSYMRNRGQFVRETVYGLNLSDRHKYENKADVMIGGQENPFWPGTTTNPCCAETAWEISSAEAIGDYMGRFLDRFYRNEGEPSTKGLPKPRFLEVINEPLYGLVTNGDHTPLEVFQFHNDVAEAIRQHDDEVLIGGYTAAFPYFDVDNFQTWENEMKLFIDTSGTSMDYFSLHYYDFNKHHFDNGRRFDGPINYKGSRLEASLDMVEHYSQLTLGVVKPLLISEYGGRDHSNEWKPWSPDRDWSFMKSYSPLMMQFMKRPDRMLKTIPFIVNKAEWGRRSNGIPYAPRLMRQAFEASGETGDHWVFSGLVKFYELWADVKGKRVHTNTNNNQILTDAYVDANKMHLILSNLNFQEEIVAIDLKGIGSSNQIATISAKHLFGGDQGEPVLQTSALEIHTNFEFTLKSEATAIIEIAFEDSVVIDETLRESLHYASTYKQEILANAPISFSFENVIISENTSGILRLGIGRGHDKSLFPEVSMNGTTLEIPTNYSGDAQVLREGFFGLLEIPIPDNIVAATNEVEIIFPDAGGFVSSAVIQMFNSSINTNELSNEAFDQPLSQYNIFPNPIREGKLNINTASEMALHIYDLQGKLVRSEKLISGENTIDVSRITTGIYFVETKTNTGSTIYKWLIE